MAAKASEAASYKSWPVLVWSKSDSDSLQIQLPSAGSNSRGIDQGGLLNQDDARSHLIYRPFDDDGDDDEDDDDDADDDDDDDDDTKYVYDMMPVPALRPGSFFTFGS
jgi:hypothetical protein